MKCPDCKTKTIVMQTQSFNDYILRRRKCPSCGKLIRTMEEQYQ